MPRPRARWGRRILIAIVLVAVLDGLWLAAHWPDWSKIARGPVPRSRFLDDWEAASKKKARWSPVGISTLPEHLLRAVVIAEDARFWGHDGFDVEALREAMSENVTRGRFAFGGSTISQQTAKNLFLTPSRTPLRKWHEAVFTWGLERHATKRRILEIYVNDAELGRGVFGVEAAAQEYFDVRASEVTREQAIRLAATLPSPKKDNPSTKTKRFQQRVAKIRRHLDRADRASGRDSAAATPATAMHASPAVVDSAGSRAPDYAITRTAPRRAPASSTRRVTSGPIARRSR